MLLTLLLKGSILCITKLRTRANKKSKICGIKKRCHIKKKEMRARAKNETKRKERKRKGVMEENQENAAKYSLVN